MSNEIVAEGKVVGFHYTLRGDSGEVIDSSSGREPLYYIHGAGHIVSGLEKTLTGKKIGQSLKVIVEPVDGYGERHEQGVQKVPKTAFAAEVDVEVGMQFGAEGPNGEAVPVWVTAVSSDTITVDFNHPLAGQRLHFDVELLSIRDSTDEERTHGHVHGPGGHHHH